MIRRNSTLDENWEGREYYCDIWKYASSRLDFLLSCEPWSQTELSCYGSRNSEKLDGRSGAIANCLQISSRQEVLLLTGDGVG